MTVTGRCYCGHVRFEAKAEPLMKGQCYCRECQYFAGGAPNNFLAMPVGSFTYTAGAPKAFTRDDMDNAVTREFCPDCGTQLATRNAGWPFVVVKVGALDSPADFKPAVAIQVADKQPFHNVPDGVKQFERWPPMG
jgi:hypothetical protein